jgi:hypothetical protein
LLSVKYLNTVNLITRIYIQHLVHTHHQKKACPGLLIPFFIEKRALLSLSGITLDFPLSSYCFRLLKPLANIEISLIIFSLPLQPDGVALSFAKETLDFDLSSLSSYVRSEFPELSLSSVLRCSKLASSFSSSLFSFLRVSARASILFSLDDKMLVSALS